MNRFGLNSITYWSPSGRDRGAFLAILLLAAFLRFFRLDQQSYWADEVFSIWQVSGHDGPIFDNLLHNFHGPLHLALLWLWGQLGDWREVWTRSLSVLGGLLAVWLIYVLARQMSERRVALWTAFLLAISPFHVWYSQEVRNYSQLICFVILSQILFVRVLEGPRVASWARFLLVSAGALLSNLSAVFLFAFQGLYLLWRRPRLFRTILVVFGLVFLLLLPWVRNYELGWHPDLIGQKSAIRHVNFHPLAFFYTFMVYSIGDTVGPSRNELNRYLSMELFTPFLVYLSVVGLTFGFLFIQGLRARYRKREGVGFFLLWILLPMLVVAVLAILNVKVYNVRYVTIGFPGYLLLLASGIERSGRRLRVALVAMTLLFTFVSLKNIYSTPRYWKPDARTAAREIAEMERPGDVIIVYSIEEPFRFYYEGPGEIRSLQGAVPRDKSFRKKMDDLGADFKRVWLVDYRGWYVDPEGEIPKAFSKRWRSVKEYEFVGIRAWLFENPNKVR